MIKYIIIEDEPSALRRLHRKLIGVRPGWSLEGKADSVVSGIELLKKKQADIIFSDIQLSDGSCFDIFKTIKISTPIIFITAYNQYAVEAFNFNSIHYLLKPIKEASLNLAIQKFENNRSQFLTPKSFDSFRQDSISQTLLSHVGKKTVIIEIQDIAYIYHSDRITMAHMKNSDSHLLDHSLDGLMSYLSHHHFFRINRQFIVNKSVVKRFERTTSNRLKLELKVSTKQELIVSKENSAPFKSWL